MNIKTLSLVSILFLPIIGITAEFLVNTTDDLIDLNPGDGICEATLATNDCSLRAAIMETNALSSSDSINLPAGVFVLNLVGDDNAALVGDLDVTSSELTVQGVSREQTIIDGNGTDRIFEFNDADITLQNLTLQNGGDASATVAGGAISASGHVSDSLNLFNIKFENNRANTGGALFIGFEVIATLKNTLITNNTTVPLGVTNIYGPAIFCSKCNLNIDSSSIYSNHIGGYAIRVEQGHLEMLNSTVSNNEEGGIRTVNADAMIKFSTIVENVYQNLSHFSFNDTEFLQIGNSVLQTTTHINCSSGDLPVSLGNNVVNDDSCNFLMPGDMENTDAGLDSLKNNGGNTMTHRPTVASVLIDQVNAMDCVGILGNPLLLDQTGAQRPNGSLCDIGAVELDGGIIFFNGFE